MALNSPTDRVEDRLTRIEQKVDKLADMMVALARAEEKIEALKDDHDNMGERMNRFSEKLDNIEKAVNENTRTISIINRLFWIVVVAGATVIASQILM
tara:strand:+ start:478 stop:771 length:294 start_codon:yes stop_codon:yes gene_type:complete